MFERALLCCFLVLFLSLGARAACGEIHPAAVAGHSGGMSTIADSAVNSQLPPSFDHPLFLWMLEVLVPIIFLIMVVHYIRQCRRAGTLTFGALLFIGTTTMFWQEWYADWGGYLLFNPQFTLMPWFSNAWVQPNRPWAVIPSYGPFFTAIFLLMLRLRKELLKRRPELSRMASVLIVGIPAFYLWDLFNEGYGTILGWQSYTQYVGPAVVTPKGNFPLLYPILLFVCYGVVTLGVLSFRDSAGRAQFESWFGVEKISAPLPRELARVGAWIIVMNGLFLLFLTGPLVILRLLFGGPSLLVP